MIDAKNSAVEIPAFLDEEKDELDWAAPEAVKKQRDSKMESAIPKPAGFWIRLLAFEIDAFLLTIGGLGLSEIVYKGLEQFGKAHTIVPFSLALFAFIGIGYFGFFESSTWKGTPGKRFLGLRVTTVRGKRISRTNAFTRTVSAFVCAMPIFAGFFAVLFTRKKQAWHDLSAKTLVLRKPQETILPDSLATWESGLIRIGALIFMMPIAMAAASASKTIVSPLLADHQRRSRIDGAIEAVKPIQAVIQASVKSGKAYPKRIDDALFKSAADESKSIVVYNPTNGVITLQFSDPRQGNLAVVSLYPMPEANGDFKWNCSAFGIQDKVLPEDCRQNKSKK